MPTGVPTHALAPARLCVWRALCAAVGARAGPPVPSQPSGYPCGGSTALKQWITSAAVKQVRSSQFAVLCASPVPLTHAARLTRCSPHLPLAAPLRCTCALFACLSAHPGADRRSTLPPTRSTSPATTAWVRGPEQACGGGRVRDGRGGRVRGRCGRGGRGGRGGQRQAWARTQRSSASSAAVCKKAPPSTSSRGVAGRRLACRGVWSPAAALERTLPAWVRRVLATPRHGVQPDVGQQHPAHPPTSDRRRRCASAHVQR